MSFFNKIRNIFQSDKAESSELTPEIEALMAFRSDLMSLQEIDKYIARSDFAYLHHKYFDIYTFFENAKRANTLDYYCNKNELEISNVEKFLSEFEDVCLNDESFIIAKHNKKYVQRHIEEEKDYLDNLLLPVDPNIKLDEEQRRVVLSDEDYTLVIGCRCRKNYYGFSKSKISC